MRAVLCLVVAFVLLLLQSTLLELSPVRLAAPNLALLAVLHVGLSARWSLGAAAIVAFATGYLLDLVSGAPQGLHAMVFILVVLIARALSTRVAVRGIVLTAATAFVSDLIAAFITVVIRAQVAPEGGYAGLAQAPLEALFTALFAPPVMAILRKIDGKLDSARSRVGLVRGGVSLRDGSVR